MDQSGTERVTVEEAARILGIKEESVRKRVQRGKIPWEKDANDRILVWVDSPGTLRDKSTDNADTSGTSVEEELRDRVRSLEHQLDQEREARRRADHIIAQLSQATAEQARTIRAIEAPASPDRPTDATEAASEATRPQDSHGDTPEGSSTLEPETPSSRPWWRRLFGG